MNIEEFYPIFLKCNEIRIDSRKVEAGDLFFAFSGDAFDAAKLSAAAIQNGALAVIVENKEYENVEKNIFYTASTLLFMQDLAMLHRSKLDIPIIGLTGSNGKTTTKELMHAVLSAKFSVLSTEGNYNNHIGVPLTLLSIKSHHEIGVIEMGANHKKEIEFLCSIAQPTIGYITNFGKAHLEGFGGMEGVIKGKSEMYTYLIENKNTMLVNQQDGIQLEKSQNYIDSITFGSPTADYYFKSYTDDHFVGLEFEGEKILSQLTGAYNFSNLSAAVALGLYFKIDFPAIKNAMENYAPSNMRSQILKKNGKVLLLDTYNANPSSMLESLKNFKSFEGVKTIIIGDMLELGEESEREHRAILEFAEQLYFDEIITVGLHFQKVNQKGLSFLKTEDLISYLENNKVNSNSILLKASRGIALEKILDHLN